jgi:hypothetical protein
MSIIRVLNVKGDTAVAWDPAKVEAGDREAMAAVKEAERIFREERDKGATAFAVETGKPAIKLERFDQTAEQIVMVPRVAGGR